MLLVNDLRHIKLQIVECLKSRICADLDLACNKIVTVVCSISRQSFRFVSILAPPKKRNVSTQTHRLETLLSIVVWCAWSNLHGVWGSPVISTEYGIPVGIPLRIPR